MELGFERKARLFCDRTSFDLQIAGDFTNSKLGFERKARLFCDVILRFSETVKPLEVP